MRESVKGEDKYGADVFMLLYVGVGVGVKCREFLLLKFNG